MPRLITKCYSKQSTIENIGDGLFASDLIKKDQIIAEFKGILRKPGEKIKSKRSNIYFLDEWILECGPDDLASFCNDPVKFPTVRRKLMESLRSDTPFYEINPNCKINATISIKTDTHRAFLIALDDIEPNEEIFNHYGFDYWFSTELITLGLESEAEIEENGFPSKIFEYPAFLNYVRVFYPDYSLYQIQKFKDGYDFTIKSTEGKFVVIYLKNYFKRISKIHHNKINQLINKNKKKMLESS